MFFLGKKVQFKNTRGALCEAPPRVFELHFFAKKNTTSTYNIEPYLPRASTSSRSIVTSNLFSIKLPNQ